MPNSKINNMNMIYDIYDFIISVILTTCINPINFYTQSVFVGDVF